MSLAARRATADDRERWGAFIAQRPDADVLQSWAWGEAGSGEPGETWLRLLVEDETGAIRGVAQVLARTAFLGRRIMYVPHGPVWEREAADASEVLDALLAALRQLGRDMAGVVLKLDPRAVPGAHGADELAALLVSRGLRRARHDLQAATTRLVALEAVPGARQDGEPWASAWSRDARAELRRARREGVQTSVSRGYPSADLEVFGELLSETSARAGFRVRSRSFLAALAAQLAADEGWFLALSRHEGRPLSGAIVARVGDRAFYLYAASTRDPELAARRGPYATMGGLMAALGEAGVRCLDLWGVREKDDPAGGLAEWEGFSLFKRRFGGQPLRHPGTFDMVLDPLWYRLRELRERLRESRS